MTPVLLTLVQWLSPAFPTGAFAYSQGLETPISDTRIEDQASAQTWIAALLRDGSGWQDAVLLAQGLRPDADLDALDALGRALCGSAGRLTETTEQGMAFARTVAAVTGRALPPRTLPLAVAEAAQPLGLPTEMVIAHYLHSLASNLVTIAVRAVPLGQSQGQALLTALHPVILDLAARAATATLDDLASSTFAADLAAISHETLQPRLFRT